jgi:reactive chlorine resistance protein C
MKIESLHAAEALLLRYGLALIFLWIGAMKFTAYEAAGIRPLADHSPLMSWLLAALGVQAFSNLLGVIGIAAGVLLALRPISALATVIGSGIAIATFLTTLTFLFTTRVGRRVSEASPRCRLYDHQPPRVLIRAAGSQ